jgi:RNA polymerase sigma factor (sigma-70 family)
MSFHHNALLAESWELTVGADEFARVNRELVRYFRRRVSRKDPNDLAADTWIRVVRWYRGRCSLRVFALLVASKVVVDVLHRKREIETIPLLDDEVPVADDPSACSVLMLLADHEVLDAAVAQVDEVHREVVRLSLTGRDNVEIAAELDIPYNTVRSRLGRGRAQVIAAVRAAAGVE